MRHTSCSACVHACCSALGLPYRALPFGGGAVIEVLHDLLCGLALSTVRHDLPQKKKGKKKTKSVSAQAAEARGIKDECEAALALALPILQDALAALDTIKEQDVGYMRKLGNPPAAIKLVLEARAQPCACANNLLFPEVAPQKTLSLEGVPPHTSSTTPQQSSKKGML